MGWSAFEAGRKIVAEITGVKTPVFFTQFQRWPTGELRFVEDWVGMVPEWMKNLRGYQPSRLEYAASDVLVAGPDGYVPSFEVLGEKS